MRSARRMTQKSTRKINCNITNIATWNIHGKLHNVFDQEILPKDMKLLKIHIACLQETRWHHDARVNVEGGTIINLAATDENEHRRYGMGFYVSNEWIPRLHGFRRLNDRICIIQLKILQDTKKLLTIINVYGPTTQMTKRNDTSEVERFYQHIKEAVELSKKNIKHDNSSWRL